ncbi:leucine-rich repeat domain-containing protein [Bacteroides sp. OttesenSCG-928-D19]|nr:leucine-rich repeat domain-containing protein [Bacteroides sp. OttesenSCG-928-D19]
MDLYAFNNCSGLTSVTILGNVTKFGSTAFNGCAKLVEFIVPEENLSCSVLDGVLFNKDKTTLLFYPAGKEGNSYVIPNSVTLIDDYAFFMCSALTSVTIPNGVTSIGVSAFSGCSGLTTVTIPNGVTSIGDFAFSSCGNLVKIRCGNPQPIAISAYVFQLVNKKNCTLYVPKGSYAAYWIATGWGDFENIVEEEITSINNPTPDTISISADKGILNIRVEVPTHINIYTVLGTIVYSGIIENDESVPLNSGIYIVKAGKESHKVIVK